MAMEIIPAGVVTESDVREAMKTIVENRQDKALNWAVNYAVEGMTMDGEELYVQCLYVLGNIGRWRGDKAKAVRTTLKHYTKQHKGGY